MLNAFTIGMNKPIIVLNSGLVDLLDEEELRFVARPRAGHAMSGHAVYQTLLRRLLALSGVLTPSRRRPRIRAIVGRAPRVVPQGRALGRPCRAAGHPGPGRRVPGAHEAGQRRAPRGPRRDLVLRPGPGVRRGRGPARLGPEVLLVENRTHPFAVVRAAELRRWVDSGEYTAILGGDLPAPGGRRRRPRSATPPGGRGSYSETFKHSQDAVGKYGPRRGGRPRQARVWLDEQLRPQQPPAE